MLRTLLYSVAVVLFLAGAVWCMTWVVNALMADAYGPPAKKTAK